MPYQSFAGLWPVAVILLLLCTPKGIKRWLLTRVKWLGFAIGLLLVLPYLLADR